MSTTEKNAAQEPRYYVQSDTIRGEGRRHYIVDRHLNHRTVTPPSRDKKRTEEKCAAMNEAATEEQHDHQHQN